VWKKAIRGRLGIGDNKYQKLKLMREKQNKKTFFYWKRKKFKITGSCYYTNTSKSSKKLIPKNLFASR
jgi:tRNA U34 5-carboxymethylaminomethyl modifying enzyme MnmG/GidA